MLRLIPLRFRHQSRWRCAIASLPAWAILGASLYSDSRIHEVQNIELTASEDR